MKKFFLFFIFFSLSFQLHGKEGSYNDFDRNPFISKEIKKRARPHLLPKDHALKPALDALFLNNRVTLNQSTLLESGFTIKFSQPRSFINVVSHPTLPGYLLKIYFDTETREKKDKPGFEWLILRCEGAKKIKKVIKKKKIQHFVVANKWLYPLPLQSIPENVTPQPFVLVVEDMQLTSKEDTNRAWKTVITKDHLVELHQIIKKASGSSYRPDNIPYTKNGNFAFIDTEYPNKKHPDYRSIRPYLSHEMRSYWDQLTK